MRLSIGTAFILAGLAAGYVTGQQALGHAGTAVVADDPQWVQQLVQPKDPYLIYALGHFRNLGLLPPPRSLLLYVRDVDSEGNTLRTSCTYALTGPEPKARWWVVSAVPPGGGAGASVSAGDVATTSDGHLVITLSRHAMPGNVLMLPNLGAFALQLALHEPYDLGKGEKLALPSIKKGACE